MKKKKGEKKGRHEANLIKRLSTGNGVVVIVMRQSNDGGVAEGRREV